MWANRDLGRLQSKQPANILIWEPWLYNNLEHGAVLKITLLKRPLSWSGPWQSISKISVSHLIRSRWLVLGNSPSTHKCLQIDNFKKIGESCFKITHDTLFNVKPKWMSSLSILLDCQGHPVEFTDTSIEPSIGHLDNRKTSTTKTACKHFVRWTCEIEN